ncbi:MAG: hypothetical protein ACD_65C00016G0003, partial [uncultured bacterium]
IFGCMTGEFLTGVVSFPFQVESIFGKSSVPKGFDKDGFEKLKDSFKVSDLKKKDYLVFVKMGKSKEKDLRFLSRVADNVEWMEL